MNLFTAHPNIRVHLYKVGEVPLSSLTDDQAMELYKNGNPYLTPTAAGRKELGLPAEETPEISVKEVNISSPPKKTNPPKKQHR